MTIALEWFLRNICPEGVRVPVPERYRLFDHIREVAGLRLSAVVGTLLPRLADELDAAATDATESRTRRALQEAAQVLREEADIRCESAAGALDELHFESLQEPVVTGGSQARQPAATPAPGSDYELLTEAALADELVAQALAGKVREALEAAYPAYLDRLAQLTGTEADEDHSPLGARALASAVVTALRPYTSDPLTREAVEAALLRHAAMPLREIIAAADRRMAEQGILPRLPRIVLFPSLRRAVAGTSRAVKGSGTVRVAPPAPAVPAATPPARSPAAPSDPAIDGRKAFAGAVAETARRIVKNATAATVLGTNPMVGSRDPHSSFRQAGLLPGVDSLERDAIAFAHRVGHAPFSTEARQEFFSQLRGQMSSAGVEPAQLATVDLVAAMFDYAADQERIPDPARPLMWRLQLPAITLACLDPGFLSDEPRSVRRLVEQVAAIATAYPDDMARGSELHGRLQTVVRAVEVVAHAFQVRSQVLAEQVRMEYRRATAGMGQLVSKVTRERRDLEANAGRRNRRDYRNRPSREREFEISGRIEKLLTERLKDRQVPESVAEFLKGVWLRHLRTAVLRDGEESAGYQAALQVVDDLLWTLDSQGSRQSRGELAQRIPAMLKILTQGIRDIGAKPEDYRPFFDEMFLIHLRRMQTRGQAKPRRAEQGAEPPVLGDATVLPPVERAPRAADEELPVLEDLPVLELPIEPDAAAATGHPPPAAPAAPIASEAAAPAAPSPRRAGGAIKPRTASSVSDAQSASELKLRRLIDNTSLDDLPRRPQRMEMDPAELVSNLAPGQWLELVSSTRKRILAKVAWINDRRSVVLLLQHPDRLILSRHVSALEERARRKRAFRIA
jgi:hypothetical protein